MSPRHEDSIGSDTRSPREPATRAPYLPHHTLTVWPYLVQLLKLVRAAGIRDPSLREQAFDAARSACLNTAEAAGRVSCGDRKRVFGIARGEAAEAASCVEVAVLEGTAPAGVEIEVIRVAAIACKMLNGLTR